MSAQAAVAEAKAAEAVVAPVCVKEAPAAVTEVKAVAEAVAEPECIKGAEAVIVEAAVAAVVAPVCVRAAAVTEVKVAEAVIEAAEAVIEAAAVKVAEVVIAAAAEAVVESRLHQQPNFAERCETLARVLCKGLHPGSLLFPGSDGVTDRLKEQP